MSGILASMWTQVEKIRSDLTIVVFCSLRAVETQARELNSGTERTSGTPRSQLQSSRSFNQDQWEIITKNWMLVKDNQVFLTRRRITI